jgi:uncharacterized protein (DUF924 family)
MAMVQPVLRFWFDELPPQQWWKVDAEIDRLITERFSDLHARAIRSELFEWRREPEGRLARSSCWISSPETSIEATVAANADLALPVERRVFLYMPYMPRAEWSWSRSVLLVLLGTLDRPQPRLAAFDPELVARHERGRCFRQDPELDLRLPIIDREQSRSTAGTEVSTAEFGGLTDVFKLVGGPDPVEGEGRATFLPAVGAVADADAKGFSANGDLYLPAKAFSRKHRHG